MTPQAYNTFIQALQQTLTADPRVIGLIALGSMAQQDYRCQGDPAAHRVYHHGTGKVVELGAEGRTYPLLNTIVATPGDPLEEGIDQCHQQEGGRQLRVEAGTLGE